MSLSGALSNAFSGLTASSRAAQLVSANIANSMTPGYARRSLALSSLSLTGQGGVRVGSVLRHVDTPVLAARRLADGALGHASARSAHFGRVEAALGLPGEPGSIPETLARFEAGLRAAAADPTTASRLSDLLHRAGDVASALNGASDAVQQERMRADTEIAGQVNRLNDGLAAVAELNTQIVSARATGADMPALLDRRQALVDELSAIVPLRTMPREDGSVALVAEGGRMLLEGTPRLFEFAETPVIAPHMNLSGGHLSGLEQDGRAVSLASLGGGTLAAAFEIRDELAPAAQDRLDALAFELASRLQSPGLDPTTPVGAPGLFTDAGQRAALANTPGLAGRIAINTAVDPGAGGDVWRLRDGLGAATPALTGDGGLLTSLADALGDSRTPAMGALGSRAAGISGLAARVLSMTGVARQAEDGHLAQATARRDALFEAELANGVDTDAEMQRLLRIEQSYAANARMIETVDELLQTLLRI